MEDRELLELAAKAAGITSDSRTLEGGYWIPEGSELQRPWNALTDDGDALRLLVSVPEVDLAWIVQSAWQACDTPQERAAYVRRKAVEKVAEIGRMIP